MINEKVTVTGQVQCFLNGVPQKTTNLVVTVGKEWIAKRMVGAGSPMSHMAVGSSGLASAAAQVGLSSESFRKLLEVAGGQSAARVATFKATFGVGEGTGVINEAGLFDAASGGTMLARSVVGPYTKGINDVLSVVWTVTIS